MFEYKNGFSKFSGTKSHKIVAETMIEKPLVSIMIPTYRRPFLLKETIESALCQQTDFPFEVVVVDNDSAGFENDVTSDIVNGFGAQNLSLYRNENNLGMIGNWNRCIELARAEWLTILHDDDLLKQGCLQELYSNRLKRSVIAASTEIFGENCRAPAAKGIIKRCISYPTEIIRFKLAKRRTVRPFDVFANCPITASGAMFNKAACLELGGYDSDQWPLCDYLFNAKYISTFGGIVLKERLVKYRIFENESNNPDTFLAVPDGTFKLRTNILRRMVSSGLVYYFLSLFISYIHKLERQIAINKYRQLGAANSVNATARLHQHGFVGNDVPHPALKLRMIFFVCWLVIAMHDLIPGTHKLTIRL